MNPFEELTKFETKKGQEFYFVEYLGDTFLRVWWEIHSNEMKQGRLNIAKTLVEVDTLKDINVWDKLDKGVQDKVVYALEHTKSEVHQRMEKARKKRKKKYDFSKFPEYLQCKCGREVKANYYALQKKADAKTVPITDLINGYQCQKCNPTRGRKKKCS